MAVNQGFQRSMNRIVRERSSSYPVQFSAQATSTENEAMFGLFNRKPREVDQPISGAMFDEIEQEHEELMVRISDYIDGRLGRMKVDVRRRRFVTRSGKAMDIGALARSVHKKKPDMPIDDIEQCVVDWLEQSYCPEGLSEEETEKLEWRVERWIGQLENSDQIGR